MNQHQLDRALHLWRFVRGDVGALEFEPWVYAEPALEEELGDELYLNVISTDFKNKEAVWSARLALGEFLRSLPGPDCMCVRLWDLDVVDMGTFVVPSPAFEQDRHWTHEDVFDHLTKVKARGRKHWWVWAARCKACDQCWLVGQEGRHNDVFCLRRLDFAEIEAIENEDHWPNDFDNYESLLQLGLDRERSVRYADPEDPALSRMIVDLARARPGIGVSELATLLNLDRAIANKLARRAASKRGVEINFDSTDRLPE